ncbi:MULTISPECIES: MobC family plasmid mobilization relaxosome protein [Streptomyces]|uniref:MobC family plasmid mobilization relaxosome protein n=1 Tax=Streptomyces TaxID=1883 RepID=UPI001F0894DC|nr:MULTISPECIES: MobC family plasmid mobilization relaxosome protein [Streptomyces]
MSHAQHHPDEDPDDPPPLPKSPPLMGRLRRAFGRSAPGGASWSERAPNGASSALAPAPAPGDAGEVRRQGAPQAVAAEDSRNQAVQTPPPRESSVDSVDTSDADAPRGAASTPAARTQHCEESLSWRVPDDPPLPALRNRKRTTEKRDQEKKIRFTPTAVRIISDAAHQRGLTFAGFVGDASLAVALGKTPLHGSPEDDPIRPLVEAVDELTAEVRRVGNNLNQVARAVNLGSTPAHADEVLTRVEKVLDRAYLFLDQLTAEGS